MAKIQVEYDENDVKKLIIQDLANKFDVDFLEKEIDVLVQSKQNYREKEWEQGKLLCKIEVRK